jgi:hypothetical protein
MSDIEYFEPYLVPEGELHPAIIAERHMLQDEHKHLKENEVHIEYLFKTEVKLKGGKQILGMVHEPKVQGHLKDLFEMLLRSFFGAMPRFIITLDHEFWKGASEHEREALLWHELAHIKQEKDAYDAPKFDRDGLPVYGLVEHDVVAFVSEVERYGAWHGSLKQMVKAANDRPATENP